MCFDRFHLPCALNRVVLEARLDLQEAFAFAALLRIRPKAITPLAHIHSELGEILLDKGDFRPLFLVVCHSFLYSL